MTAASHAESNAYPGDHTHDDPQHHARHALRGFTFRQAEALGYQKKK